MIWSRSRIASMESVRTGFSSTDAESTGIETASCRFQLYEWFAQLKTAFSGGMRSENFSCAMPLSLLPVESR